MLKLLLLLIALPVIGFIYFALYNKWQAKHTGGNRYYSRPLAERRALKTKIKSHGILLRPFANLMAAVIPNSKQLMTFSYKGTYGPGAVANEKTFERASQYQPGPEDVFVATQMKCGTTWMQQIVYEILMRGEGDFSDQGHGHLYNTAPWIETRQGTAMEDSPLIGPDQKRLIKTHMPTELCPYSENAKYVYVARQPVSCFASCVDFIEMLAGPFAPNRQALADWFCSEKMFWQSWPTHINGWWRWSKERENILFVHFEDLKADPAKTIAAIARFLEVDLSEEQLAKVIDKSSFRYMQEHEFYFEMSPPNLFSESSDTRFMQSGKSARHKDVDDATRERIVRFCGERLDEDYLVNCPYGELKG